MASIPPQSQVCDLIADAYRGIDSICKTNCACRKKQRARMPIPKILERVRRSCRFGETLHSMKGRIQGFLLYTLHPKKNKIWYT